MYVLSTRCLVNIYIVSLRAENLKLNAPAYYKKNGYYESFLWSIEMVWARIEIG